ncbi:MAG: serine/threonine-protein kinase [Polyangiaceae bacterium]
MAAVAKNLAPILGRYVLHGEIASGGMATIHLGRLQGAAGFTRSVAIKRLHAQYAKDPEFVAMFVDEARLAARIAHPNVVPTLDVVSQNGELLLVMEYVRGTSLSRLFRTLNQRGERIPPRIAASIIAGMLHGLHAAHEAKGESGEPLHIVHRDVSPQNVLVGTDGVARVLDFGVAKATGRSQSTQLGQLKGKIPYMAVEQITTGNVTRQTDVYAAAVVLWETLTGKRLFRADNDAKLLSLVIAGQVPPPSKVASGVPLGFDTIVMQALDRNPAKRFATAREMASAVEAVVGAAPSTEVGEWVERVAAEELREREKRIADFERVGTVPPKSPASPAREAATIVQRRIPGAIPGREAPSHAVPLAVAKTLSPPQPLESRQRSIGAAALALCATALTVLVLQLRHHPSPPSFSASHSSSLRAATGAAATVNSTSGWTPVATSSAAPIPTLDLASTPTAVPNTAPGRSSKQPVLTKPQGAPPREDCNPPFTTDSKGHVHFKPACVN